MLMRQCPRLDHRRAHPGPGKNQAKCGRSACLSCGSHAPTDVLRKQLLSLCIGFLFLKWGWFAKVAIFPLIVSEFSNWKAKTGQRTMRSKPHPRAYVTVLNCVCVFPVTPAHFLHGRDPYRISPTTTASPATGVYCALVKYLLNEWGWLKGQTPLS